MKYGIELIRLIAVILVTFTHTRHPFAEGWQYVVLEVLPRHGTLVLSLVSGYLFVFNYKKRPFAAKKVRTLLIPFLIANAIVLLPVVLFNMLGYNYLNRLDYNLELLYNGLFALSEAPVNPPSYFIRDLFIVFVLAEVALFRQWRWLLLLVPLAIWGHILLRPEIGVLFAIGGAVAFVEKKYSAAVAILCVLSLIASFAGLFGDMYYVALYGTSGAIFTLSLLITFPPIDIGRYSYLLHLYHSPAIVAAYPLLLNMSDDPFFTAILQIVVACCFAGLLTLLIGNFPRLRIASGGR